MYRIVFIFLINIIFSQVITDLSLISAKSFGTAGAMVSNPHSIEAVFHNPSGLAHLKGETQILFGTTLLYGLDFLEHQYVSVSFPKGFAFTYQHLGTSMKGLSQSDQDSGLFSSHGFLNNANGSLSKEKSISFSQGIFLLNDKNSRISIGYNLNYLILYQASSAGPAGDGSNGLASSKITSYTADLGFYASLRDKVSFGAFVKNLSNTELYKGSGTVTLPRRLDLGITYYPLNSLVTTFALERVLGNNENSFRFGIEYQFNNSFSIRSGIQQKPNRFGIGCSYKFQLFELSYSLLTHPVLSESSVFDIKVYFD
tara:strand:- start:372 stop:1310 length:939 start_codon:yes stop_codon:yes gene_type:complete